MHPRAIRCRGTLSPCTPRQEPEVPAPPGFFSKPCCRFSSSALRANIARVFARPSAARDREYVRGSAPNTPGRNLRFLHLPVFSQNYAAVSARPRSARTLRASLRGRRPHTEAGGRRPPCTLCQGTEFPGPSAFHPCLRYQRFRIYFSASVHHRPLCALQISSRSPKRLSFSAAFPNSSIAVSGISILL